MRNAGKITSQKPALKICENNLFDGHIGSFRIERTAREFDDARANQLPDLNALVEPGDLDYRVLLGVAVAVFGDGHLGADVADWLSVETLAVMALLAHRIVTGQF
jgi:hypothetical protein